MTQEHRIGFLITARLKSTRLQRKLLLDLEGETLIERVINRAKKIHGLDNIVVCTSTNQDDDELMAIAQRCDVDCFRGSEEDVLQRLLDAATHFGLDHFLNITGENPLFSLEYADQMRMELLTGNYDFVFVEEFPVGAATYGLKAKALQLVCLVKREIDTEIWGPLINQPSLFAVKRLQPRNEWKLPNLRLTVDYVEDYQFMQRVFAEVENEAIYEFDKIMNYLGEHPEVLAIHANRTQAALSKDTLDRINAFYASHFAEVLRLKERIYEDQPVR